MNHEKIAVLVDSGSDVSKEFAEGLDIYSMPLRVTIDGKGYIDGVDITAKEIYAALDTSEVMSSLPSGEDILAQIQELKDAGYTHILAITISSGLSGTHNIVRLLSESEEGVTIHVVDTKNISLGSGLVAIEAARYIKAGHSFEETVQFVEKALKRSKVFFTLESLEYLRRGGRIGLVAGTVANVLNIKPIMSCNEDGVYYTVTKIRGFKRSIEKMFDVAKETANGAKARVVLLNADISLDMDGLIAQVKARFPQVDKIELTSITPALGIHTGPESLGIAVYVMD